MTVEDRIKMTLGNMVVQTTAQATQIEDLTAKLAEKDQEIADLKSKLLLPKDGSEIWSEQFAAETAPKTNGAGAQAA